MATFDETHPHQFAVAGGGKAFLWPGSGLRDAKPRWIVAAEIVETGRRYLRTCAQVQPRWIEPIAEHVLKRTYRDVHWDRDAASAVAVERVALFGVAIVQGRRVRYGPIDPVVSRQMLIQHGLVEGELDTDAPFFLHNQKLLDDAERLQAKVRRNDLVRDFTARYEFYDRRIPADVFDGARLAQWLRREQHGAVRTRRAVGAVVHERKRRVSRRRGGIARRRVPRRAAHRFRLVGAAIQVRARRRGRRRHAHGADGEAGRPVGPAGRLARAGPVGAESRGADPLAAEGTATAAGARA